MPRRVLVIGASGPVGRQVVSQLVSAGADVRALSRDPEAAGIPGGVRGDLTQPETLDAALAGVEAVFLVWTAPATAVPAALARIAKHTPRILFLSSPYQNPHPLFQGAQPNAMSAMHAEIERHIRASGREWTFLRPGMFASNAAPWWAAQIRAGDVVRWPYAEVPTAPIDVADIAAVAIRALCEDSHAGAEYVLTGPESLSQRAQIEIIGEVLGRPLRCEEITPEAWLEDGLMPPAIGRMLLAAWSAARGQPALVTSTVQDVTGRRPRTFRDWASAHAAEFR